MGWARDMEKCLVPSRAQDRDVPSRSRGQPSSAPSSPLATTARSRSSRTSRLLDEQTVRQSSRTAALEKIGTAGEFQRELMQKYRCIDQNCTNLIITTIAILTPANHANTSISLHPNMNRGRIAYRLARLHWNNPLLNFWTIGKVFREQSLASLVNQSSILQCSN